MDANFLMVPSQFKVDIFGEINRLLDVKYDFFVPDKVLAELKALTKKGGQKEKKMARIGLELAKNMKVLGVKGADTDEAIISMVDKDTVVCTNDKLLREKIRERGGKVIFLRQRKFLELEGGLIGVS
jgi:rRNA-processing protein FCF1